MTESIHPSDPPVASAPDAGSTAPVAAPALGAAGVTVERKTLENLLVGWLTEQRKSRHWRNGIRIAWLVVVLMLTWFFVERNESPTQFANPHTSVIEIKGEIAADTDASADVVNSSLRSALEDTGTQAIVLLINSPGGSPVQAGLINDEIHRLRIKYNKPIYAVCEEMCASAAFYIAVAADQIFVDKASIVGSIGVLMDGFGFTGLMDKLGVERRLLTAGENKGFLDPFSPQSDRQKAYAQTMLDQIHQQFIAAVKTGRGKRLKETPETFTGLFWSGQTAVEMGLADQLGSVDYVAREVVKAEDLVNYTRKDNVAERLAKRIGASIGEAIVKTSAHMVPTLR